MPELPEVETVRRTLAEAVLGQRVTRVTVRRRDMVQGDTRPGALGQGATITDLIRHGKQLAFVMDSGKAVCVHLGMSGSLTLADTDQEHPPHTHITWRLRDGHEVRFTDARRFGGLWTFPSVTAMRDGRWSALGPDALVITPGQLHAGLSRTRRALKAALLDQALVAGLGNIYVDELLFGCGLRPTIRADTLTRAHATKLVRRMRPLLQKAVQARGTSLRDYVDGRGRPGGYRQRLRVYGRSGEACLTCSTILASGLVAGRTTVWCPSCQPGGDGLTREEKD